MSFKDAHRKVNRARDHIQGIETRVAIMHKTVSSVVEVDAANGCETVKYSFDDSEAFSDIALMLGDTIHNLNCALDYSWLLTIQQLVPSSVKNRAKLPVHETVDEIEGVLRKAEIDKSCSALFGFMLETIRPYKGGDVAIWPVHTLANRDKHRLLIPILSSAHIEGLEVEDERGQAHKGRASTDRLIKPPYFLTFEKSLHVKSTGRITAEILVDDGKVGHAVGVPESLVHYAYYIDCIVESFEAFLETHQI